MRLFLTLVICYLSFQFSGAENNNDITARDFQDLQLTMAERLAKYGYPSETHYVTTTDGYILKMYRVPYGRSCSRQKIKQLKKPPVILVHGLLSSSYDFIGAGPGIALGYLLPDKCFDTWIPNNRGNYESINHTFLSTSSRKFWDFSWHEMGVFDSPAIIDYVLRKTGRPQVHYIGHSEVTMPAIGGTQFIIMASRHPKETLNKVKSFHGLAPAAWMTQVVPVVRAIAPYINPLKHIIGDLGVYQIHPKSEKTEVALRQLCLTKKTFEFNKLCLDLLYELVGYDAHQMNSTLFPMFIHMIGSGSSVKQLTHYIQETASGHFRQYDHGRCNNIAEYGTPEPPDYQPEKIIVPMYFHFSQDDLVAVKPNILQLFKVTNTSKLLQIPTSIKFAHFDFLVGKNVKGLVYDGMIKKLNES